VQIPSAGSESGERLEEKMSGFWEFSLVLAGPDLAGRRSDPWVLDLANGCGSNISQNHDIRCNYISRINQGLKMEKFEKEFGFDGYGTSCPFLERQSGDRTR
jgi:hypothetical protein